MLAKGVTARWGCKSTQGEQRMFAVWGYHCYWTLAWILDAILGSVMVDNPVWLAVVVGCLCLGSVTKLGTKE